MAITERTYKDIQKVNEEMSTIEVGKKSYAEVSQRIKAFRKLYPEGFILTEIISNENGVCVMKASVGYYEKRYFMFGGWCTGGFEVPDLWGEHS